MGKPISLFSGYSQLENRTTNYCLLILKMLYTDSPRHLGEVLTSLLDEDLTDRIGVVFRQQERKPSGIPDGLITQAPVTIFIETKNFDWFYDSQLESHLNDLAQETPGLNILLAISNFDSEDSHRFDGIRDCCQRIHKGRVSFAAISFQKLVEALDQVEGVSDAVADAIGDFRDYLDELGLLPSWPRMLDVVNCAGTPEEVLDGGVYMCPATGGAYNHQRCRYFGMYRLKRVEQIAEIEAVVEVDLAGVDQLKWANVELDPAEVKQLARRKLQELRPGTGAGVGPPASR